MTTTTSELLVMERGGYPALGSKVGVVESTVTLGDVLSAANDRAQAIEFNAETLVLCAGFEVVEATTNAVTASLGWNASGAGSATELMGETATDAAAGTNVSGGYSKANVLGAADGIIVAEVSGDPGAAGSIRVWAVVADVQDL